MKNKISHSVITSKKVYQRFMFKSVKNLLGVISKGNEFHCLANQFFKKEPAFEVLY